MTTLEIATHFVDILCNRGFSVTSTCKDWALRAIEFRELGAEGSALYHRLSQIDSNYDSRGTTANFQSACRYPQGRNGAQRTIRSFFRLCNDLNLPLPQGISSWKEIFSSCKKPDTDSQPCAEDNATTSPLPSLFMIRSLSTRSIFCQSLVTTGSLTQQQMEHAAERYRLGARVDESVVFWQIDHEGDVCDGKVMYYGSDCHRLKDNDHRPKSMSSVLKHQYNHDGEPELRQDWRGNRCLFGEHLLQEANTENSIVAIVESEKTAVIMSEHYPEAAGRTVIWLATGGINQFHPSLLQPLTDYRIVIFPDTDLTGATYQQWLGIAKTAQPRMKHPIYVSNLLEKHASREEKGKKIDITDWCLPEAK